MSVMKNAPFDRKDLKACGTKVVIEKLERYHEMRNVGGIDLPDDYKQGGVLCKGVVISVGSDAALEGLEAGMTVLYDTHSVFYDTHPIVITNVENVIVVVHEKEERHV